VGDLLGKAKARCRVVNKKYLAKVIGYCSSCCLALPTGRFHLSSLYKDLHSKCGWGKNVDVRLCDKSMKELEFFWLSPKACNVGRSWFPPHKTYNLFCDLVTDASKYAWGAHLTCPENTFVIKNLS
jgi:hypothetical protein